MIRFLRALLSRALPADHRVVVLRELDEEYGGRPWAHGVEALRSLPSAIGLRVRRWRVGGFGTDLRHGARALIRVPWYAATLTGVIAASTAFGVTAFAIVDGALFRPLPLHGEHRVFAVSPAFSQLSPRPRGYSASIAELEAWQAALPEAGFGAAYTVDRQALGPAESVNSSRVTAGYLDALGVRPLMGGFSDTDFSDSSAHRPALITFELWQRRFGADPDVLGATYRGDRGGVRIVGILPPRFTMPGFSPPELLTPLTLVGRERFARNSNNEVIVRLPSGMAREQAEEKMLAAQARLSPEWPPVPAGPNDTDAGRISRGPADQIRMVPIRDALTVGVSEMSWMVFAGALVLLVLACVNVGALAAARARDRWRDMSVRRAIGARSLDVFRTLAAEHVLVVAAGGSIGMWLCRPVLHATLDRMPAFLLLRDADINVRVLIFAALLAMLCLALMATLATAASRGPDLQPSLADGGAATRRGGSYLLTIQVALAVVVVTGSALVVGSLIRVWREDHGFATSAGLVRMSAPPGATARQIEQLVEQLGRVPGVAQAGGTTGSVLQRELVDSSFNPPPGEAVAYMGDYGVTAGFFEALGIDLVDGRFPTAAEFGSGAPVAVVSVSAARAYWNDRPALGKLLTSQGQSFTVIGVVGDGRYTVWERAPVGEVYRPMKSVPTPRLRSLAVVPRPGVRLVDVSTSIAKACPDCRVFAATTVADALDETIARRRFQAWLFAGFGGIALLITGTGMLGLVAMTTARRTREIGIRLALGATRPTVVRQILRGQLGAIVIGVTAGGIAAAAAVRPLESLLYKTGVYDPAAWSVAVITLTLVALVGAVLPSLRASRVNVMQILKPE